MSLVNKKVHVTCSYFHKAAATDTNVQLREETYHRSFVVSTTYDPTGVVLRTKTGQQNLIVMA